LSAGFPFGRLPRAAPTQSRSILLMNGERVQLLSAGCRSVFGGWHAREEDKISARACETVELINEVAGGAD
jgi:hypothetical protein